MHYSENWGGYRLGLAEKKVGTRNSLAKKTAFNLLYKP